MDTVYKLASLVPFLPRLLPWMKRGCDHRVGPSRLSVRSPLSERAQSMPAARAGAKDLVNKKLQRIRGRDRGFFSCDRR
jgi:hypothetical protein